MRTLKGKLISEGYYDVSNGTRVIVRLTDYGSAIINTYPTGMYVDEVDASKLDMFVEKDNNDSEVGRRSSTPFGYSVRTGGLSNTGTKLNK